MALYDVQNSTHASREQHPLRIVSLLNLELSQELKIQTMF